MWDGRSRPWRCVVESCSVAAVPTAAAGRRDGGSSPRLQDGRVSSGPLPGSTRHPAPSGHIGPRHLVALPGVLSSHHQSQQVLG